MKCGKAHCSCNNAFAKSMVFYEQRMHNFVISRGILPLMCLLLMWALADHSFRVEAAAAKLEPSATTRPSMASTEDDMIGLREDIFELQQPDTQRESSSGEMKKKSRSEGLRQSRKIKQAKYEESINVEADHEVKEITGTINSINIQKSQGKPKKSSSSRSRKESTNPHNGGQSKLKLKSDKLEVNKELPQKESGGVKDKVSTKQQNRSANTDDGNDRANPDDHHVEEKAEKVAVEREEKAEEVAEEREEKAEEVAEEKEEDKELIAEYNLGDPITDWDRQRQEWMAENPEVKRERLFILTGTQPSPCANPEGDHLLLRCFKNKVDYSRIHGVGMFYNTALLDAHMPTFWAKLPVVRATMLAHPEVEWIWWLDADAIITDMEFEIPLQRYAAYNLVVHGWESLVFEKRSWLGLNAGSFLLRNCQWSMDLLERWASMGPKAPMGDAYRHILSDFLPDRPRNPTDDQAALVYLLIKERERWADKLRVELDFFLSGYWLELMDGFEATEKQYRAMEERHAELVELLQLQGDVGKEKMVRAVGRAREKHLSGASVHERRPFITHFTGCQPCSGNHNTIYSKEQCSVGLVRALNYADDQVLRTLGYQHHALHLPDVLPHSFSRSSI